MLDFSFVTPFQENDVLEDGKNENNFIKKKRCSPLIDKSEIKNKDVFFLINLE